MADGGATAGVDGSDGVTAASEGATEGEAGNETAGETGNETAGETGNETAGTSEGETAGETGNETSGETEGETAGETGDPMPITCMEATDYVSCSMAINTEDGSGTPGGCVWYQSHEVTGENDMGMPTMCGFETTGTGVCTYLIGADDGCINDLGDKCDGRSIWYRPGTTANSWEVVLGNSCRPISGFELCGEFGSANEAEEVVPCGCACEIP